MLVVTRKTREILILDDFLVMKVVDTRGKRVTIGIAVPVNTRIFRSNIHKLGSLLKKDKLSSDSSKTTKARRKLNNESLTTEIFTLGLGERAIIDDDIVIHIIDIHGKQIRVGIEAQGKIDIHRWEVYKDTKVESKDLIEIAITEIDKAIFALSVSENKPNTQMKDFSAVLDIAVSHDISPDNLSKLLFSLNRLHINLSNQPLAIESIKIGIPDSVYNVAETASSETKV